MPIKIDCFKAYDIRGQIPNQLNPDVAYRIGNATAKFLNAKENCARAATFACPARN